MGKIRGKYLLVLISMCGLLATSVGLTTNVAGLFFTPIAEEFGILKGSVSMTLTICNLVFAAGGMVAPRLWNEKSLKKLLILGTALVAGGTALLGLCSNIILMYILNAVRGFAAGVMGFVLVTMIINNWFHENVGLATSIAMSTSGFAGALLSPVISGIITNSGWRTGYMIVAVIMVILNLPAILFLPSIDPKTKGLSALGAKEETEEKKAAVSDKGVTSVSFALLGVGILFAFTACGATALPQHFPGITDAYAMAPAVGAMMLSVCMIANSCGKIVLGVLIDKLGAKPSLMLYGILTIAAAAILLLLRSPFMMYVAAACYGLTYALGTVGVVMITKELFGMENYGRTYPLISLFGTVANALLSSLIGFMYDFSGNYVGTLIMFMVMLGINLCITLFTLKNTKTA